MAEEYVPVREAARRLGMQPKSLRKRMYDGTFVRGVHWFHPPKLAVRFKWSAVEALIERDRTLNNAGAAFGPDIPPAR